MSEQKKVLYKQDKSLGEGAFGTVETWLPIDDSGDVIPSRDPLTALKEAEIKKRASATEEEKAAGIQPTTTLKEKQATILDALRSHPIARKTAKPGSQAKLFLEREATNLQTARIIKLLNNNSAADPSYIDMELKRGKPLSNCFAEIQKLDFAQKAQIMLQLVLQLQDLHRSGLLHNDIKPENILLDIDWSDPANPKCDSTLIDFGHGMSPESKDSKSGTPSLTEKLTTLTTDGISIPYFFGSIYHPPETLGASARGQNSHYTTLADIYLLVRPLLIILGIPQPQAAKDNAAKAHASLVAKDLASSETPFTFDHADFNSIPDITLDRETNLRSTLGRFLNRMQHRDYQKRPNDMEVSTFFSLVYKLALYHKQAPSIELQNTQTTIMTALASMANGKWSPHGDSKLTSPSKPRNAIATDSKAISQPARGFFATQGLGQIYARLENNDTTPPSTQPRAWPWHKKAIVANLTLLLGCSAGIGGGYIFAGQDTNNFLTNDIKVPQIGEIPTWAIAASAFAATAILIFVYCYYTQQESADKQVLPEAKKEVDIISPPVSTASYSGAPAQS